MASANFVRCISAVGWHPDTVPSRIPERQMAFTRDSAPPSDCGRLNDSEGPSHLTLLATNTPHLTFTSFNVSDHGAS